MKKSISILAILGLLISCGSLGKVFTGGGIEQKNYLVDIPFDYTNNFAIVEVTINDKNYNFLIDTGAPTVISHEIYDDLGLKPKDVTIITDSQGNRNRQEIAILPEMTLGNLTYKDIGCVVVDLRDVFEFDCMGIDGIIGANQMAKSFWKFDYVANKVQITDELNNFSLKDYTDTLSFSTSTQLTPYVYGHANGKKVLFTYDTGKGGNIDLERDVDSFPNATGYTRYGNSGIGLYGAIDSIQIRTIKLDSLRLGNIDLGPQLVDLDDGSLIGNDFMNKHEIVMDWQSNSIYLKKLKDYEKAIDSSFGFRYRYKNNKALVTTLVEEFPTDLKLDDEILRINEHELQNLDAITSCERFSTIKLREKDTLNLTIKRKDSIFQTVIIARALIE